MLAIYVVTLVYNHIQHVIYPRIELYPNFDIPGGYHPADKMGFTFQYPRNIQSKFYRIEYFWYKLWVTWYLQPIWSHKNLLSVPLKILILCFYLMVKAPIIYWC